MTKHYIGLMSGTSMDGIDGVILRRSDDRLDIIQATHLEMPASLRQEFLALNQSGSDELHRANLAANELVRLCARVVQTLLVHARLAAKDIHAIGSHGQTVRHQPAERGNTPSADQPWQAYTLQLNNPALLAELTGITVVADFRSRDVAAGGQGAPLVPAFHRAVFAQAGVNVAVVNIGGMANATVLPGDSNAVSGYDTGPGNVLMDLWCEHHTRARFDANGAWGHQGTAHSRLLAHMLDDPFFRLTGPKSTGRELFNADWLHRQLADTHTTELRPVDVQATLRELTAQSIARSLPESVERVVVCGGGAFNAHLLQSLATALGNTSVVSSGDVGLPAMEVEAAAFAWLAEQAMNGRPGNLVSVTGAAGPRILGAIYPA